MGGRARCHGVMVVSAVSDREAYPLLLNLGKNVLCRVKHFREHATLLVLSPASIYPDRRYTG